MVLPLSNDLLSCFHLDSERQA